MHRFSDHANLVLIGFAVILGSLPVMVVVGSLWAAVAAYGNNLGANLPLIGLFVFGCVVVFLTGISLLAGRPELGGKVTLSVVVFFVLRVVVVGKIVLSATALVVVVLGSVAWLLGLASSSEEAIYALAPPVLVAFSLVGIAVSLLVLMRHWEHVVVFLDFGQDCYRRYHYNPGS